MQLLTYEDNGGLTKDSVIGQHVVPLPLRGAKNLREIFGEIREFEQQSMLFWHREVESALSYLKDARNEWPANLKCVFLYRAERYACLNDPFAAKDVVERAGLEGLVHIFGDAVANPLAPQARALILNLVDADPEAPNLEIFKLLTPTDDTSILTLRLLARSSDNPFGFSRLLQHTYWDLLKTGLDKRGASCPLEASKEAIDHLSVKLLGDVRNNARRLWCANCSVLKNIHHTELREGRIGDMETADALKELQRIANSALNLMDDAAAFAKQCGRNFAHYFYINTKGIEPEFQEMMHSLLAEQCMLTDQTANLRRALRAVRDRLQIRIRGKASILGTNGDAELVQWARGELARILKCNEIEV